MATRLLHSTHRHWMSVFIIGSAIYTAIIAVPLQAATPVSGEYMMFRLADEFNDKKAQYIVGRKYYNGTGVDKNIDKAVKYFTRSAEQGYRKAQYQLGKMYLYGENVPTNFLAAYDFLSKAAQKDHVNAKFELANLLFHNKYGRKDTETAIKLYHAAAEERHAGAQYMLGIIYYEGKSVNKDEEKGTQWLKSAVEYGDKRAKKYLTALEAKKPKSAPIVAAKQSKPATRNKVSKQFKQALNMAKSGDVDSQYVVGMQYLKGKQAPKEPLRAVTWLRKAAEQDHAGAQYQLGLLYRDGMAVAKSESEAIKWFRLAASWGVSSAQRDLEGLLRKQLLASKQGLANNRALYKADHQYLLGMMYVKGSGVEKSPETAAQWLRKAAAQNHPEAQFQLGEMYKTGLGVKPDAKEAKLWLAKAADGGLDKANASLKSILKAEEQRILDKDLDALKNSPVFSYLNKADEGDLESQYKVGLMFLHGNNEVGKDVNKGLRYLQLAAEDEHLHAQLKLGELYFNGLEIEKDFFTAAKWFKKAAEQGNPDAQYNLGNMYRKGQGVQKSNAKAVKWYQVAAKQGHQKARNRLGGCRMC